MKQSRWDLASADPASDPEDPRLHQLVRELAVGAQEAATVKPAAHVPWWKRRRNTIPLSIAGVVALTGAAVVIPLNSWVDHQRVDLDVEIPIVYVTDSGVEVSCRYGIYFGRPAARSDADENLAEFVRNHDWTGIGQRIYDRAIDNPFTPGPGDDWENDSQELRDQASFIHATDLILEEIPNELQETMNVSSATMDCKGQLH